MPRAPQLPPRLLRLPALYREPGGPIPEAGDRADLTRAQLREMEAAVTAALRAGRVSLQDGRQELETLRGAAATMEALRVRKVPAVIASEPAPVRKLRGVEARKAARKRQAEARKKNRRKKKPRR